MKPLSETYNELGIAFKFPITIKDAKGKITYYENSCGFCYNCEYDAKGNLTYFEDSDNYCEKSERDANGNRTYYEDSDDNWEKWEYDAYGEVTYYENSRGIKQGTPLSAKTFEGKVVEVDGIKYKTAL